MAGLGTGHTDLGCVCIDLNTSCHLCPHLEIYQIIQSVQVLLFFSGYFLVSLTSLLGFAGLGLWANYQGLGFVIPGTETALMDLFSSFLSAFPACLLSRYFGEGWDGIKGREMQTPSWGGSIQIHQGISGMRDWMEPGQGGRSCPGMAAEGHRNVSQQPWNLLGWVKTSAHPTLVLTQLTDGYLGWMEFSQAFPGASCIQRSLSVLSSP